MTPEIGIDYAWKTDKISAESPKSIDANPRFTGSVD